jgi:hypothetical protein
VRIASHSSRWLGANSNQASLETEKKALMGKIGG